jgi:hypothetical protein
MTQHDLVVDDSDGATVLADINAALQALGSSNKGNSAPSTPYTGQIWVDGDTPSSTVWNVNMYDGTDWILLGKLDTTNNKFIPSAAISALRTLWIPAASMIPSISGGCAGLAVIASGASKPDIATLDFDKDTAEYAQFSVAMPKGWDEGTVTAQFVWSHAATTTNFKVAWGLQGVAISDDDTIVASYGTAQTANDTGGTTDDLYVSPSTSAITIGGSPAAGDIAFFRVYRDAADGTNDTLAVDARLHGVRLFYTIDTLDDA